MTDAEALAVSAASVVVDGRCSHCVGGLLERLADSLPDVEWGGFFTEADGYREWSLIRDQDGFAEAVSRPVEGRRTHD